MINDAEKFADEDAKLKGKVEARNELESYAYSLNSQLSDKEKLGGKLSDEELKVAKEQMISRVRAVASESPALKLRPKSDLPQTPGKGESTTEEQE